MNLIMRIGIALLFISNVGNAQSRYHIIYESNMGMKFGSENISTIHYLWQSFDNRFIPTNIFKSKAKILDIGYRLTKLFFTDYPIGFLLMVWQHERFGHGARAYEFGVKNTKTYVDVPPPFSFKLSVGFSKTISSKWTPQQRITYLIGGSEASILLSNTIRKNILLDNKINHQSAFFYLYSNNDLSGYTAFINSLSNKGAIMDPIAYVENINDFYGKNKLSLEKLRLYGIFSLILDPMNYYAFNSIFNGYIYNGRASSDIYLIPLSENFKYLPKAGFNLAPYGVEISLQNYFKYNAQLYSFDISHTDGTLESAWRLSANGWNILKFDKFSFNFEGQMWYQPRIEFYKKDILKYSEGMGAMLLTTIYYDFIDTGKRFGVVFQTGYKSRGFVKGEILDKGLILRGGLSFNFE